VFRSGVIGTLICAVAATAGAQSGAESRPPQTPEGIREQIARLSAPDAVSRAFAACYLAEMRGDAAPALQALTGLLADATPIDPVLCRRDGPGAFTASATWKSAPGEEAARALAALGQDGIEALLSATASSSVDVRRHAVQGLVFVRDERVRAVFVSAMHDVDARTREVAARGLGRFRDSTAVEALLAGLKDQNAAVREESARALGRTQRGRR
jgi:HEAT repeat protein